MANHPNIKKERRGIPPASPTPEQICEIRNAIGLTQTEAAALVYCSLRAWQAWEALPGASNGRTMPAAAWELFLLKIIRHNPPVPPEIARHLQQILESIHAPKTQ